MRNTKWWKSQGTRCTKQISEFSKYKWAVTARSKILNKAHKDSTSRMHVTARSETLNEAHEDSTLRMVWLFSWLGEGRGAYSLRIINFAKSCNKDTVGNNCQLNALSFHFFNTWQCPAHISSNCISVNKAAWNELNLMQGTNQQCEAIMKTILYHEGYLVSCRNIFHDQSTCNKFSSLSI